MILEQTQRIAAKTRQITDFAVARGETSEPVDVNQMVKAVCDFLAFERSFRTTTIQFQAGAELPARVIVPDHLTESLMNLLQMHVESTADNLPARNLMTVKTLVRADDVVIQIACNAIAAHELADRVAADPRMAATRRRIFAMGGQLRSTGIAMEISLPPA
jgi:C4-dicarboxylate-specific signal transduction histidine kinase